MNKAHALRSFVVKETGYGVTLAEQTVSGLSPYNALLTLLRGYSTPAELVTVTEKSSTGLFITQKLFFVPDCWNIANILDTSKMMKVLSGGQCHLTDKGIVVLDNKYYALHIEIPYDYLLLFDAQIAECWSPENMMKKMYVVPALHQLEQIAHAYTKEIHILT